MPLPSWVGRRLPEKEFKFADSPWTAPGFRVIGRPFYTCVPPVDRGVDPAVLRMAREICPDLVPIWRKQVYQRPRSAQTFVATHLCLGRFVRDPRGKVRVPYVEMPPNPTHPMPNVIEKVLEDKDHETVLHHGGPGPYEPLTMQTYRELRKRDELRDNRPQWEIDQENEAKRQEIQARRLAQKQAELDYIRRDIDRFVQKQLDAPGDTVAAFKQWKRLRAFQQMRRRRLLGSVKPMVHVQGV